MIEILRHMHETGEYTYDRRRWFVSGRNRVIIERGEVSADVYYALSKDGQVALKKRLAPQLHPKDFGMAEREFPINKKENK